MLKLIPDQKPVLQRQLDADQAHFSRQLELETDASFDAEQLQAFRMQGLFGVIPGSDSAPVLMHPSSAQRA